MRHQLKQLLNGLGNANGFHTGIETHYNGGSNACLVIVARE